MSTTAGAKVLTPASTSVEILEHLLAVSSSITPVGAMELLRILPETENSRKVLAFCMGAPLSTKKIIGAKLQEAGVTVSEAMSTGDTINMSVFAMLGHIGYMMETGSYTADGLRARGVYREKIGGVDNVTLFHAGIDMGNRSERQIVLQRWATRLRGFNANPYAHLYTRLLPDYFKGYAPFSLSGVFKYIFWSGRFSPLAWIIWGVAMIFIKPYQWITWLTGPTLGWLWSFEKYYLLIFIITHFLIPVTTVTVLKPFAKDPDSLSNLLPMDTFGNVVSMATRQAVWIPVMHWGIGKTGASAATSALLGGWGYSKMAFKDITLLIAGDDLTIPKKVRKYFASKESRWVLTDTQDFIVGTANITLLTLGGMPLITNLTSSEEMYWRKAVSFPDIRTGAATDASNLFSWVPFNDSIAKYLKGMFGKAKAASPALPAAGSAAAPNGSGSASEDISPTKSTVWKKTSYGTQENPMSLGEVVPEFEARMEARKGEQDDEDTLSESDEDDEDLSKMNSFNDSL